MARKPDLAGVLSHLPEQSAPAPIPTRTRARRRPDQSQGPAAPTVLVGGNLHPSYARNLAFLHAETGRDKKDLLQEALDLLFKAKGLGAKR